MLWALETCLNQFYRSELIHFVILSSVMSSSVELNCIFGLLFERPYLMQGWKLMFMWIMVRFVDHEYNPLISPIIHGLFIFVISKTLSFRKNAKVFVFLVRLKKKVFSPVFWSFVWKTLLDARLKADVHVDYGQICRLWV